MRSLENLNYTAESSGQVLCSRSYVFYCIQSTTTFEEMRFATQQSPSNIKLKLSSLHCYTYAALQSSRTPDTHLRAFSTSLDRNRIGRSSQLVAVSGILKLIY